MDEAYREHHKLYMRNYRKSDKSKKYMRDYFRRWRANGGERQIHWEKKRKAITYKGGACVDCGLIFDDIEECAQFDHINPESKEYTPGYIIRMSWARAVVELDKCELVCANCHSLRTAWRARDYIPREEARK